MEPVEPLRIGILGAARIARLAIIDPARSLGHRLVAVAARDEDRATAFAAEHGIEHVRRSYAQLLADPEVEVVYNGLVNGLHAPWNLAAVAAGKHVLTEKPFSSNAFEAREVRDAAAGAGVTVLEGFHYLYHPVTQRLHELAASGELGELTAVQAKVAIPDPGPDDPRWSLPLAGGALMDIGCYGLHAIRDLAPLMGGAPRLVSVTGAARAGRPGLDERVDARFSYPGGGTGELRCWMAAERVEFSCRVVGSRGEARAGNFVRPDTDDRVTVRTAAGERVEHLGWRPSYEFQLEALAAHLREGVPLRNDLDDAVANMELVDECYRAAGFTERPRMRA